MLDPSLKLKSFILIYINQVQQKIKTRLNLFPNLKRKFKERKNYVINSLNLLPNIKVPI